MPFYKKSLFIGGPWDGEYKECSENPEHFVPIPKKRVFHEMSLDEACHQPIQMARYIRTTITVGHTGVIVYVLIGIQEADVMDLIIKALQAFSCEPYKQ